MNAKPDKQKSPAPRAAWILIAVLLLIIAVLTVFLIRAIHTRQGPWATRTAAIANVPATDDEEKRALRYTLTTAEEAQAYFQRLLDSDYIGLRGDVTEPAEQADGLWRLREENGDGTELTAAFDAEGVITELHIGTNLGGTMETSTTPYEDDSLYAYIRAFAYEYLPDIAIDSGRVVLDQYSDAGRFITFQTASRYADPAHEFVLQVDPIVRVVGFRLLADREDAYTRISRMAPDADATPLPEAQPAESPGAEAARPTQSEIVKIARDALVQTLDIPADEVADFIVVEVARYSDTSHSWYGYTPAAPYWMVSFRMPKSDERIISDYDLIIDAATGAVLRLFDPSNNSNGCLTFLLG